MNAVQVGAHVFVADEPKTKRNDDDPRKTEVVGKKPREKRLSNRMYSPALNRYPWSSSRGFLPQGRGVLSAF